MNTSDLHVRLLTLYAVPSLSRLTRSPTDDELDAALGAGYRALEGKLPFDECCDLYCDLDARWKTYRDALRERLVSRS